MSQSESREDFEVDSGAGRSVGGEGSLRPPLRIRSLASDPGRAEEGARAIPRARERRLKRRRPFRSAGGPEVSASVRESKEDPWDSVPFSSLEDERHRGNATGTITVLREEWDKHPGRHRGGAEVDGNTGRHGRGRTRDGPWGATGQGPVRLPPATHDAH